MRHPDRESLTLVALGERPVVDELSAHLDRCAQCRSEVTAMRDTVALAREAGPGPLEAPPEHVWSGIAAELALDGVGPPPPARVLRARRHRRGILAVAAAAVVALVAAVAVGIAGLPGEPEPPGPREIASASLATYGAGPPGASGRVIVHDAGDGPRLDVSAVIPPAPDGGYYEVWLLDERSGDMVAIGALGEAGRGSFTMPAGLDVPSHPVVDVSAERYDGDPTHSASVLRGTLAF